MDPKSSDVDTIEGANIELGRTRSMELSTDFGFLALEKAEISAASEGEDEDEKADEDEDEVEDTDSIESDQEWDVDSFEGFECNSDPEDTEDWRRYLRQCHKSEGFDVPRDYLPTNPDRIYCGFNPLDLDAYFSPPDISGREYMENMLKVKKNLVMDHIVRAVVILGGGVKAYITFMAKESPEGELVEYQGKAEWKVWQRNIHPLLCRPASEQRQLD
ncbi:unnamed protein product [Arabidopsis arenosa]|uniref:Uncharacterized protein n=1 Tax=Arabidopsis arenosa TaxID=38785 RepID=A0A8S1ZBQ0_ARAAE|nr:unnamed protein product [Arabidopsis arenosa]